MKYAILSDIHANPMAFHAAIDDARDQGANSIICLGDITGYGYGALAAYELAKSNCDVLLMGNHDAACAGVLPIQETLVNPNYKVDILAREELGMDRLEELSTLPYVYETATMACTHGEFVMPSFFAYISTGNDALLSFEACPKQIMFVGHTHKQETWCLVDGSHLLHTEAPLIRLQPNIRYIVNVGSVGYPRRDPFSSYAVYDESAAPWKSASCFSISTAISPPSSRCPSIRPAGCSPDQNFLISSCQARFVSSSGATRMPRHW